jgi:hypothetical protein
LRVDEFARWDIFVGRSPQGTLFHTALWLQASGHPFQLLGCFRGAELLGGFALGLLGERFGGAPCPSLTPYLGVLFSPRPDAKYVTEISANKEIAGAFATFLKRNFDRIELPLAPEAVDMQPFIWQGFDVRLHYTYRLRVENLPAVLDGMDAGRRRNLSSAEKQGLRIEIGADFAEILRLRERSFERQFMATTDSPVAVHIETVLRGKKRCQSFLTRSPTGEALGGVWIAWDEKRAYYLIGGYDNAAKSNNAVALAMWNAIKFTTDELMLAEFDFEGSIIPPVERFFRKFGARLTPFYELRYRHHGPVWRTARRISRLIKS